jgi:hypothetical protein
MGIVVRAVEVCSRSRDRREQQYSARIPERPLQMLGSERLFGSGACSGAASFEQRWDYLPQPRCWLAKHDEIDDEDEGDEVAEVVEEYN